MLAEALRPELHVPVGQVAQRSAYGIRTWICRPSFVSARYCNVAKSPGRIRSERALRARCGKLAGAGEKSLGVDAHQRRRQHADRREDAEPAANRRRDVERGDSFRVRDLAQRSLGRIGHEDEMVLRRFSSTP